MTRLRDRTGSALLTSLLVVMLAFIIVLAVTTRATLTVSSIARDQWRAIAFNSAEAGIAAAVQQVRLEADPSFSTPVSCGIGSYEVAVVERGRVGPWNRLDLIATGRCREVQVALRVELLVRPTRRSYEEGPPQVRLLQWRQLPPPGRGS